MSNGNNGISIYKGSHRSPDRLEILNNTIAAFGGSSTVIHAGETDFLGLYNNVLYAEATDSYFIYEFYPSHEILNNAFCGNSYNLFYDSSGWGLLTDIADVNDPIRTTQGDSETASGNSLATVVFEDPANELYYPTDASDAFIKTGGRDLSGQVQDDANGNPRTIPWSIGPVELD